MATTTQQTPLHARSPPLPTPAKKRAREEPDAGSADEERGCAPPQPKAAKTCEDLPDDVYNTSHASEKYVDVYIADKSNPVRVPWSVLASVEGSVLERMVSLEWNGGKHPTSIRIENELWHVFKWLLHRLMRKQDLAPPPQGIAESDWVATLKYWKFVEDEIRDVQPKQAPAAGEATGTTTDGISSILPHLLTLMRNHPKMPHFLSGYTMSVSYTFAWPRDEVTRKPSGYANQMRAYVDAVPMTYMMLDVPFLPDRLNVTTWLCKNASAVKRLLMKEFLDCVVLVQPESKPEPGCKTMVTTSGWPATEGSKRNYIAVCRAKYIICNIHISRPISIGKPV
jgi:hypothetical protein